MPSHSPGVGEKKKKGETGKGKKKKSTDLTREKKKGERSASSTEKGNA